MQMLTYRSAINRLGLVTAKIKMRSGIRYFGPMALLPLLGCAANGTDSPIFDYVAPTAQSATSVPFKPSKNTELPKNKSSAGLLGDYQAGPGYVIRPEIISDGRYNTYVFETEHGTYSLAGDDMAREHIHELIALDTLKKYSKTKEFLDGVGNAVVSPVKAVFNTVTDPVGAAGGTYKNVERKIASAQRGLSKAGEYIATIGNPEQRHPDREDDGFIEKLVDRPKAKRRLARELMVDPYTHFVPLADELDKVASYSAAGEFGVDRAVSFVPGAAGIAISSLQTLDSFATQTLDMDPEETAAFNRERLEQIKVPDATIKAVLLNSNLTPTEKTLAVGYLANIPATSGRDALASFVASRDTRHSAFATLLTLSYLSSHPFGDQEASNVEIIDNTPVVSLDANKIAIITSDDLAWTPSNAEQLSKVGDVLKGSGKAGTKKEIRISGDATPLAKRELQRRGWVVKIDAFRALR
jgi:hypothetical protein